MQMCFVHYPLEHPIFQSLIYDGTFCPIFTFYIYILSNLYIYIYILSILYRVTDQSLTCWTESEKPWCKDQFLNRVTYLLQTLLPPSQLVFICVGLFFIYHISKCFLLTHDHI